MKHLDEDKRRLLAAAKILDEETTSRDKLEAVRKLIMGINPALDKILTQASKAWRLVEQVHKGKVIDVVTENLPERSAEEKKRKRGLLLFIKWWRQLKGEVKRVQKEMQNPSGAGSGLRILAKAKGPVGVITLVALGIVAVIWVTKQSPTPKVETQKQTIKVIVVDGKQIPITEAETASGPECDGEHYHAKDRVAVRAVDGTLVTDPGRCGLGKVSEIRVEEIEI